MGKTALAECYILLAHGDEWGCSGHSSAAPTVGVTVDPAGAIKAI
jgi:hypothetical protein